MFLPDLLIPTIERSQWISVDNTLTDIRQDASIGELSLLPAPREGSSNVQIQVPVVDAWLDHRPFKPLVEGRNRDPIGIAGQGPVPALAVRSTVMARHNIGSLTSWDTGIVIARKDSSSPDFVCMVRMIVGIDFVAKTLIYRRDIVLQNAPIGSAEQVNAVKNVQQVDVGTFSRPDDLVARIHLLTNRRLHCESASMLQGIRYEDDRLAMPVKVMRIIAVAREHVP